MKKRFVSMALSLLMLLTAIATSACEDDSAEDTLGLEGDTAKAMTISIWGIKGKGTTDEAIAAVEAAMSKITQVQFNTAIELNLYTEKEYKDALIERMDTIQAQIDAEKAEADARKQAEKEAKKRGEEITKVETTETTADTAEETILDEYGLPTTLYPEVEEDQLDIFLVTDFDMLKELQEREVLSSLDEQLSGSCKILKQYVHPTIVSAGKVGGKTVCIPNQQLVGEYTYMLVNKELFDKYYWDIDTVSTLSDVYDFIVDVKREEPEYQPLVGDVSPININYFSLNGERTVFGNMLGVDKVSGDSFEPMFLFSSTNWKRHIRLYKQLDHAGCIPTEKYTTFTPETKFGVGIMKGTEVDLAAYAEDYHAIVLQVPQGTAENIYNGMFAVSTYTKNLARSMEVLTYLNTNAELRNLFGYGIEDVHYTVGEDGVVDVISNDYNMKLEYTGNCFMAYVPEGQPADYWDIAKRHNIELVLSPYFQFKITEDMFDEDMMELYRIIRDFSEEFYAALDKTTNADEVEECIDYYWELCDDDEAKDGKYNGKLKLWVEQTPLAENDKEDPPMTIGKLYKDWFNKKR